jgi:FKBP-type peptidyl-prolyl cis-trans isomerase FkpA
MKKFGIFSLIIAVLFIGCKADNGCKNISPSSEESQITAFAAANSIAAVKHGTGMYYEILAQGSGATPNLNSTVTITYTGKRLDGSIFDQATTAVSYKLADFIEGWKVGLPLIQKGGHIKLIVPSSMAYGCNGYPPVIGGNSVLYFDIQLIDVQ